MMSFLHHTRAHTHTHSDTDRGVGELRGRGQHMLRQLLILAKLVQTRLVFSCGTKHVQLICSLAKTKFPKFPTANWTRTTICIAASVGAQAFAWVLVLPPGEALLLLFSDKLICISVTPPASQPRSPSARPAACLPTVKSLFI